MQLRFVIVIFCCAILCYCNAKKYSKAENALDAGREFIDGCLKGDFEKAAFYMLDDDRNKELLLAQKRNRKKWSTIMHLSLSTKMQPLMIQHILLTIKILTIKSVEK